MGHWLRRTEEWGQGLVVRKSVPLAITLPNQSRRGGLRLTTSRGARPQLCRNASTGSTRTARAAGRKDAATPAATSVRTIAA